MIPLLFNTADNGKAIPEINPESAWVLEEPFIAVNMYDGTPHQLRKRLFKNKWFFEYNNEWLAFNNIDRYPNLKEALSFPPHESGITKYIPGNYELIRLDIGWRMASHDYGLILSDIQSLQLDLAPSVEAVYNDLRRTLYYMPIKGVVFKSRDFKKQAKLRKSDFDFFKEELKERLEAAKQSRRGTRKTLS